MKHAVKHIHCVGMIDPSREQGSCLMDAAGREDRQLYTSGASKGIQG